MKKLITILVASVACLSVSAYAADDNNGTFFGKSAPGKWMVSIKVAQVSNDGVEISQVSNLNNGYDEATAVGLILGYHFARPVGLNGSSTLEFEILPSADGDVNSGGIVGQWQADILNAHMSYRSAGKLYFNLKGGLSYASVDLVSNGGRKLETQDDVNFSFGGGLGLKMGHWGALELEYSSTVGDLDLGIFALNGIAEF